MRRIPKTREYNQAVIKNIPDSASMLLYPKQAEKYDFDAWKTSSNKAALLRIPISEHFK
jgi:hypothetical protein